MLAGIGAALRWCEELLVLASGPVLTFGLGVGLVALLTDGQLLVAASWLLYAWGVAMAMGVDGQLIGAAVKAGRAFRAGKWWHVLGYLVIIAAVGYVAYLAGIVFATVQAEGITTAQALHRLGMDNTTWITERTAVAVGLTILSGLLRYDPATPAVETAEERTEREARELAQARHRAELRAVNAAGIRGTIAAGLGQVNPLDTPPDHQSVEGAQSEAISDAMPVDHPADTTRNEPLRKRANPGVKAVPSDMMSAPQFRALLAQNGVHISAEKAVAIVQSTQGCERVGVTYCARKAALMRVANRMIEASNTASNDAADTDTLAG